MRLTDLEKHIDSKLTVFMSAISTDCEKKVATKITAINNVILYQKKQMSEMESRLQKYIANNMKNMNSNQHTCPPNEDIPKWSDLKNIDLRYESSQSNILNDQLLLKDKLEIMETKITSIESTKHQQST